MSELSWIQRYVDRNPYTGAAVFDEEGALASPEYRKMMRGTWNGGYDAGFDDGVADSSVETQTQNPFL